MSKPLNRFSREYYCKIHVLSPEDREKVAGAFRAVYLGDYDNLPNCDAYLHLLDESIRVTVVPEHVGQCLTSISGSYDPSNV